jgi:hypothetical protein
VDLEFDCDLEGSCQFGSLSAVLGTENSPPSSWRLGGLERRSIRLVKADQRSVVRICDAEVSPALNSPVYTRLYSTHVLVCAYYCIPSKIPPSTLHIRVQIWLSPRSAGSGHNVRDTVALKNVPSGGYVFAAIFSISLSSRLRKEKKYRYAAYAILIRGRLVLRSCENTCCQPYR